MTPPNEKLSGVQISNAWKRWIFSDAGKQCAEGITTGEYLENRLHRAFHAGVEAAEKIKGDSRP